MVRNYLIIGADSELAKAFIQFNSNKDTGFYKLSRNKNESDLEIKDYLLDVEKITNYVKKLPPCYVIFFNGYLAENRPIQFPSIHEISLTYKINFQIPFLLTQRLSHLDNLEKFVFISSIAAVKPRYKNYIYGNTKNMLEKSIVGSGIKNVLFLRFGKIKTRMSKDHKDLLFTLNKTEASELIFRKIKKTGIRYPNYKVLLVSFALRSLPVKLLNRIEKSLG